MKPVSVRQRDISDCGAACLASVAAAYGLSLPVSRIRQLASTDRKGTNIVGMIDAATKLGFDAKGVRGTFESLYKIPIPAIAHVVVDRTLHHFVVIYKATARYIEVMDPAGGQIRRYRHDEFKALWTGVLVLLWPKDNFQHRRDTTTIAARLGMLIRPHRAIMFQAVFGAMVYTILGLSTSIYVQKIVDYVLVDGNRNLLTLMSIAMIALLTIQILIGATKSVFTLRTGQMIDARLILGYYKHLLRLPKRFFDTMRTGEIISRVNDAVKIRTFVNDVAIGMIVNMFVVISAFALMFTYYWKLALVIFTVVPLYGALYWVTNSLNRRTERRLMEKAADVEAEFVESLHAISTVKSFGLEDCMNDRVESRFVSLLKAIYTSGKNGIITGSTAEFISRSLTIALLWAGAGYVLDRTITPGELLSFYALAGYFTGPAASLIGMNRSIQNARIAADRLFEIMDLETESIGRLQLTFEMVADIRLTNVHFRYGSGTPVFQGLNLTIPKGRITAIVGESGSGKSTLISVVQGIYPIQSGSVCMGDIDLKYADRASLQNLIAVVPQRLDLFAGTIAENIALGHAEPDWHQIINICRRLQMLEMVECLPDGFNTIVGERGATLSGGQCQRIAIARALYREPPILFLDEATSSLDALSEDHVQHVIRTLREEGKTIVIVAHRLSTIRCADRIIVLQNGMNVEEGTHQELITSQSHYRQLWMRQHEPFESTSRHPIP